MKLLIFLLLLSANCLGQINDPQRRFCRIDTTVGYVMAPSKSSMCSHLIEAIKVDSVFACSQRVPKYPKPNPDGSVNLIIMFSIHTWEEREIISIKTNGRSLDLTKRYVFIPENEMQE